MQTLKEKDPQIIVIDEVAGQWLTLSAAPADPFYFILGFVLFRIADIRKFWPASLIDNKLKGALGIMMDDAVAGCYAALTLSLVVLLFG